METIDIQVMGREFSVAVKPDEKEVLLAAAELVDRKMRDLAAKPNSGGDTLAVMAALSLTHEFLASQRAGGVDLPAYRRRIESMVGQIDRALSQQEKLF